MRTSKIHLCLCLFLSTMTGVGLGQLSTPIPAPSMMDPSPQAPEPYTASEAVRTFGLKLVTAVASQNRHKNVFVSPLSVFAALAMAETGSAGQTQKSIRETLAVEPSVSETTLHESLSALLQSLKSQKGVELSIANGLWSDVQWPLKPSFVEQCKTFYEADVTALDFSQATAVADTINSWVKEKTKGKIPDIVGPDFVQASKAILTNAVYFMGGWSYKFDKDQTKPGPFHLVNGKKKDVPFMHQTELEGVYRKGHGFEAAALPYKNSQMRLYAILPAPGKSPEEVLSKISLDELRSTSSDYELDLALPRFTLDFSAPLKTTLEHMGMSAAFQPGADFTPMGPLNFFISDVVHKTRLEVDEEGTVAAAATGIGMATATMRRPPRRVLVFDRPFAILLCDDKTDTILFAGVIYEPQ